MKCMLTILCFHQQRIKAYIMQLEKERETWRKKQGEENYEPQGVLQPDTMASFCGFSGDHPTRNPFNKIILSYVM